ncbi:hypothetical protein DAEQUDRAFT_665382 [Daedalea quercina L-15889]|uniref:Vacuolar sorting protein Vps3844 C-terminal domain-containing protein n=1 Tax=Daedalea quercina L-15889 TaxID=1314783 RepID=A0A165S9H3_9APHY|nr:hypothetical protein DAEQUDRAFT_665382 [Daedalea quercina L-15889]
MKAIAVCALLVGVTGAVDIYLHPASPAAPSLSASQASAALSRHLGLEYHEALGDDLETNEGIGRQESFVGKGPGSALLVGVNEEDAAAAIPASYETSFSLPSDLSAASLSTLIPTYLDRARQAYSHIFAPESLPEKTPRIIDIFSVPSSASQSFLSQMTTLVDFVESDDVPTDKFAAVHLTGLSELAAEHGRDSEQYKLAAETIRGFLSSVTEKRDLKLAVVTLPSSVLQVKRQVSSALQQPPQTPFPAPKPGPAEPIDAVATCYTTTEACGNSTSSCSGHGECVQATKQGRTCYVCACSATKSSSGQTENWAGSACERKDISGPFTLLSGTVVALILLVGGSVALLTTIGEQELPSTLTGGVAPPRKE